MTPRRFFSKFPLYCCPMCGNHVGFIQTWCEEHWTRTLPVDADAALLLCEASSVRPQDVAEWYLANMMHEPGQESEAHLWEFGGPSVCRRD